MEKLFSYLFSDELKADPEKIHSCLLTEAAMNPRADRERMCELMFEEIKVPKLALEIGGLLAIFGVGKYTGVYLDIGDGVAHTVPVCDGWVLPCNMMRSNIAGCDLTDYMA